MTHEASLHEKNCFLTLTYADEHLPENNSLDVTHMQNFFKRFRKKISPVKIRHYYCGEYGEKEGRAHYHAIIFGYDFPDKIHTETGKKGDKIYMSEELADLWPLGRHGIGEVTYESAGYVARYCTKKITGPKADAHYNGRKPEFAHMSKQPRYPGEAAGLGGGWITKYYREIYPDDFVVLNGKKIQPPAYYDKVLETVDPELYRKVKAARVQHQYKTMKEDRPQPRTLDQLTVKEAQASQLTRK